MSQPNEESTDPVSNPETAKTSIPFLVGITVLALGTVLSLIAYRVLNQQESRLVHAQLNAAAELRVRVLEKAFRQAAFSPFRRGQRFDASRAETRERFAAVAQRHLDNSTCTRFLAWSPKVDESNREEMLQLANRQGLPNFKIFKVGNSSAWSDEDISLPIVFLSDETENRDQLGLDLVSIPECATAITEALTYGRPASTRAFRWPIGEIQSATIAIIRPVITQSATQRTKEDRLQNMIGIGVSVVDADAMISDAFDAFPRDVDLRLYKDDADQEHQFVGLYKAKSQTIRFTDLESATRPRDEIATASNLKVAGGWSIQCIATPEF